MYKQPNRITPFKQLRNKAAPDNNLTKTTSNILLKRIQTNQRGETPIRKRKTSCGKLKREPSPNLQLSQRKDFKKIQNSLIKNYFISITPDFINHRYLYITQPEIYCKKCE